MVEGFTTILKQYESFLKECRTNGVKITENADAFKAHKALERRLQEAMVTQELDLKAKVHDLMKRDVPFCDSNEIDPADMSLKEEKRKTFRQKFVASRMSRRQFNRAVRNREAMVMNKGKFTTAFRMELKIHETACQEMEAFVNSKIQELAMNYNEVI